MNQNALEMIVISFCGTWTNRETSYKQDLENNRNKSFKKFKAKFDSRLKHMKRELTTPRYGN